jgi:cell division protein FtsN
MPRDYKYRAAPKKGHKPVPPAWVWMAVGLLLGAFIVGLVWLKLASPIEEKRWVSAEPDRQPQRTSEPEKPVKLPPHKPRFEFYEKLREQEIVVPDEQLALRDKTEGIDPTARYNIQIASFAKPGDAERLKASLALLGVEVRVEQAKLNTDQVRHRVLAGPYIGKTALDAARKRLKENGHQNLLIRITQ